MKIGVLIQAPYIGAAACTAGGGDSNIDLVYVYVPAFWGAFLEIWYSDRGGGSSDAETKEPKLHKLGVFWVNYCKKHLVWVKLGACFSKMVYWWVGNGVENWYRERQIFEIRPAGMHIHVYDF